MPQKFNAYAGVITLNLTTPAGAQALEALLNDPEVVLDRSKDIQYFFDDKSGRILALIYYTRLDYKPRDVIATPREVLEAEEGEWDANDQ